MANIGLVSCQQYKNKIKEDLLLQQSIIDNGHYCEIISWDAQNENLKRFDCLVLRSVWGYQNYYSEFKKWLLYIMENNIKLINNPQLILDNIRKNIQFNILDKNYIPHIPTIFIDNIESLKYYIQNYDNFVIKPIISGSGNNTYLYNKNKEFIEKSKDRRDINSILREAKSIISTEDNGIILQPYFKSIKNGEYACIFIDGINTHNILRYPGIFTDKEHPIYLKSIPESVRKLASKVSNIKDFENYSYMRVDIIVYNEVPYIMEVELAEPDLYIRNIDDAIYKKKVVNTLVRKIEREIL